MPALTVRSVLQTICEVALEHRRAFDALDRNAGDGDFGSTLARGFSALRDELRSGDEDGDPAELLVAAARTLTARMGGSSGPLFGVAFLRAGQVAREHGDGITSATVMEMIERARDGIVEYGGAEVGDKTLLDALAPAVDALADALPETAGPEALAAAARAARDGAQSTAQLQARRGRASYVGERSVGSIDPGAVAIAVIAQAVAELAGASEVADARSLLNDPGADDDGAGSDPGGDQETRTAHFFNHADDFVDDALRGLAAASPDLRVDRDARIVVRADAPEPGRVALVSGGGSGHEPMHTGLVGPGMLDAAVPGAVFTSPSPDQVLAATRAVQGGEGVLHIVKNYTGDVLNFRLAAELAREEGIEVTSVIVADDVAVRDSTATVGRRGTGLTVVVEKLAGARAAQGASLSEVGAIAERALEIGASFGIALGPATLPGSGPSFELGEGEVELGIGIHGEPGRERGPLRTARELAQALLDPVLEELSLEEGDDVLVLLNGFGATTQLELFVLFGHVHSALAQRDITVSRSLVGEYVTSLDMPGASVTLLKLDDELRALWDAPVATPAMRWG